MAMDPVGKEDKDVDNDGKVTKADKYLMARRRAIAKRMKEEVELEEGNYDDMIAAFKAKGGTVKKVAYVEPDEKAKAKLGASWTRGGAGGKGGSAKANAEYSSMNDTTKKYNVKQAANLRKTLGVKEEIELEEAVQVNKKNYSWGKMITVRHGSSHSFPLHPEHQEKIKNLKDGESTAFRDETGSHVTAHREGDKVHLKLRGANQKTTVAHSHFTEEVELDEAQIKKPTKTEREIALVDGSPNSSAKMGVNKLAYKLANEPKKKVSLPKAPWNEETELGEGFKYANVDLKDVKATIDAHRATGEAARHMGGGKIAYTGKSLTKPNKQ